MLLLTGSGHVEVKVKAVFTLIGEKRQQLLHVEQAAPGELQQRLRAVSDVRRPLRTHSAEPVRQSGVPPKRRGHRWHVPENVDEVSETFVMYAFFPYKYLVLGLDNL